MGTYLTELLNDTYGIETIHHEGVYDLVDGKLDRSMAYELAEPQIQKILAENPSIEVVIDLHRDGVAEGTGGRDQGEAYGSDHVLQRA